MNDKMPSPPPAPKKRARTHVEIQEFKERISGSSSKRKLNFDLCENDRRQININLRNDLSNNKLKRENAFLDK